MAFGSYTWHVNGDPWMCSSSYVTAIDHSPASSGWKTAAYTPSSHFTGHCNARPEGASAVTSMSPPPAPLLLIWK